jgi:hypothetical protein
MIASLGESDDELTVGDASGSNSRASKVTGKPTEKESPVLQRKLKRKRTSVDSEADLGKDTGGRKDAVPKDTKPASAKPGPISTAPAAPKKTPLPGTPTKPALSSKKSGQGQGLVVPETPVKGVSFGPVSRRTILEEGYGEDDEAEEEVKGGMVGSDPRVGISETREWNAFGWTFSYSRFPYLFFG